MPSQRRLDRSAPPDAWGRVGVPSALGEFTIVWQDSIQGTRVCLVLLPGEASPVLPPGEASPEAPARRPGRAGPGPRSNAAIMELADRMRRYLGGQAVELPLDLVDFGLCSGFQRRVLLAEYRIPRGRVSTYGRLAAGLGAPAAARAVGSALARNPFPIIIPCHRTVRSDGDLGGFRGGPDMKRALLELEGVELTPAGRAPARFFC